MIKLHGSKFKEVKLRKRSDSGKRGEYKFYHVIIWKLRSGYKVQVEYGKCPTPTNKGYIKMMYKTNIVKLNRALPHFKYIVDNKLVKGYLKYA